MLRGILALRCQLLSCEELRVGWLSRRNNSINLLLNLSKFRQSLCSFDRRAISKPCVEQGAYAGKNASPECALPSAKALRSNDSFSDGTCNDLLRNRSDADFHGLLHSFRGGKLSCCFCCCRTKKSSSSSCCNWIYDSRSRSVQRSFASQLPTHASKHQASLRRRTFLLRYGWKRWSLYGSSWIIKTHPSLCEESCSLSQRLASALQKASAQPSESLTSSAQSFSSFLS